MAENKRLGDFVATEFSMFPVVDLRFISIGIMLLTILR